MSSSSVLSSQNLIAELTGNNEQIMAVVWAVFTTPLLWSCCLGALYSTLLVSIMMGMTALWHT